MITLYPLRGEARRRDNALVLNLLDAAEDQLFLYGFRVDILHHACGLSLRQTGYLLKNRPRILKARLDAFEVQDGQTAESSDYPCRLDIDGGVQRTR